MAAHLFYTGGRGDGYQPVVKVGHSGILGIDMTAHLFYTGGHGDGYDT